MAAYSLTGTSSVKRNLDGSVIPFDAGNRDYVAYLSWVSQGNTPDPYNPPSTTFPIVNPVMTPTYTVATAPSASANANTIITITDLPEGSRNCWSDGTNWRRISDDTIVV